MRRALMLLVVVASVALLVPVSSATADPAHGTADDPAFAQGLQWNLAMIGAPKAWTVGQGAGVTIAVIDSGVDPRHEDLAANMAGSVSCIGTGGDPGLCSGSGADDNGHGSHVAGIAAAVTDNKLGVAGVAPRAKLLGIRVLTDRCQPTDCSAEGDSSDVAAGVRWAVRHGAKVVNLSLGSDASSLTSDTLSAALRYAWAQGAVPVIAAGNATDKPLDVGDLPVVVVTAVNRDDRQASYANDVGTSKWALSAPGGEPGDNDTTCRTGGQPRGVLSTYWDPSLGANQYACLAGTSMAAPHVAGALAILLGLGFTPRQAVQRLLTTTSPVVGGTESTTGAGLLNVANAVMSGPPPAAPTTTSTTTTPDTAAVAASGQSATPLATDRRQTPTSDAATSDTDSHEILAALAAAMIAVIAAAQLRETRRRSRPS